MLVARNMRFASKKNPRESVKSESSVVYELGRIPFANDA